jgi:hypothetical protein
MRQLLIPTRFTQEFKTMVRTGTEESLSVFRVSAVLLRNSNTGCHYQTKKNLLIIYHFISIQNFFKLIFQNPSLIISSHVPLGLQSSQTQMYEDYDLLQYDTV